jgi:hypothetical protein
MSKGLSYGETIHMKVLQGFERHYDPMYYVLLLLKTIYGLKQSTFQFWKAMLLCFSSMEYKNTRYYFLRELKEAGLMRVIWRSGLDMSSDMLTKNLARPLFEKHITTYCGEDEYLK